MPCPFIVDLQSSIALFESPSVAGVSREAPSNAAPQNAVDQDEADVAAVGEDPMPLHKQTDGGICYPSPLAMDCEAMVGLVERSAAVIADKMMSGDLHMVSCDFA
jgi:hypothetical protein